MGRKKLAAVTAPPPPLKLDFGCGPNPREGFEGVDQYSFDGKVKYVMQIAWRSPDIPGLLDPVTGKDARILPSGFVQWPWSDGSVGEAYCSHFVEHLNAQERVHFFNELHRILIPNGSCQIITPHWASNRAYGDPTHQWPPVSEMAFFYLNRDWRAVNAPHTDIAHNPAGFNCHFEATWGYGLRGDIASRNPEFQQFAVQNYKEVCADMIATLKKLSLSDKPADKPAS